MAKPDFTVIEDEKEIKRAQLAFAKNMKKKVTKSGFLFPAGIFGKLDTPKGGKVRAYWYEIDKTKRNNIWWANPPNKGCWWNIFRFIHIKTGEPAWNHSNGMTVQINSPLSGNTWRQAGVFVKDSYNKIYIAHTGKLGGGRPKIGRKLFVDKYPHYQTQAQEVTGSRGKKRVVIISDINSPKLLSNIHHFVKAVDKIKPNGSRQILKKSKRKLPKKSKRKLPKKSKRKLPKKSKRKLKSKLTEFRSGFIGTTKSSSTKKQKRQRRIHDKILERIIDISKEQGLHLDAWYTNNIDLYLTSKSKKSVLIELKTDSRTGSIYKAIGQLFYYSLTHSQVKDPKLVAVFPKSRPKIKKEMKKVLGRLGIEYITYTKAKKQPKFDNTLDKILKDL